MRTVYDNLSIGGLVATYNSLPAIVTTSPVVDTKGYNSAALRIYTTATGAVSLPGGGVSLVAVLQECATSNGVFTSALDNTGTAIGGTITPTTTAILSSFRVEGLLQNRLRYLRVQLTPNFPAAVDRPIALIFTATALLELGRAYNNPVATTPQGTLPPATSNT